ncbi:hypothetical protein DFP94_11947 [Fontibacillus phaseoli]|uniref:SH3 domain-containing protein n=1 Tax=Fontibacillus phaseoli TaxID=1416533 RepID=A0A369B0H5_9BACL|nr:hypothetical protein [Fontibacillus phaseoli]RCX13936.1 hypothetical protein DFP94_11947 [Fontibacillus phaseoli]
MKKLAALSASLILTAAFATAVSADPVVDPVPPVVDEPLVAAEDIIIAPNPVQLLETTYFYADPNGKALSALAPQEVHPTGQRIDDWVQIYTWLGNAWIYLPGYVPTYF